METKRKVDRKAGVALLIVSLVGFAVYAYFLLGTDWGIVIVKLTVLVVVAALLAVLAWIGYTIATAPRNSGDVSKKSDGNAGSAT